MSFLCKQILTTICPCFFKGNNNLAPYEDTEFIEKQEFINNELIDHDFDIKHKTANYTKGQTSSTIASSNSQSQRKQLEIQDEELFKRLQKQTAVQTNPNSATQSQERFLDYTDAISPDNPYYDILYPKLQILSTIFDIDQKYQLQVGQTKFPLKMFCKQSEARKTNIFIYTFQFQNTNHEAYEALLNNFQVQKKFDSNINEYFKKVQSPNNDTKVIYLSYHKVLIVAPRDFVYVKYIFKKGKQFWSVSTSLPNQKDQSDKIRGEIVMTATKIVQRQNKIVVDVYSQINMKMAIKPQMAKNRGKSQILKYLQKCYSYLNSNQTQNIL